MSFGVPMRFDAVQVYDSDPDFDKLIADYAELQQAVRTAIATLKDDSITTRVAFSTAVDTLEKSLKSNKPAARRQNWGF